ncbi:hypothetical protein [Rummeliibacillus sp. POC4]|uniref:hypothetical protein n=1 Tax=Rummeliibacillus sp. POC4 TaxID=2305899 RepID=UPI000E66DECC|nr:hypothetical protein [Rummeliibacillus sp. POC4]RIJ63428.1 hypothetical protein D1606_14910 [Rummeliibacillus sp. POC4]
MEEVIKPKKKKVILLLVVFILLIAGGSIFGWYKYQQNQKEQYAKNLAKTSADMQLEFLLSSMLVAGYSEVWNNAIDSDMDFNVQLTTYQENLSKKGTLDDRENGQNKIRDKMKLLQNPPKEYKDSYNALKKMYGTYSKMVDQSLSPTGSLIEFNKNTNELYSQFEQQQEELQITLPADVKKLKKKYEKEKSKE